MKRNLQKQRITKSDLIYIIGLSKEMSNEDLLMNSHYFGQFGKVRKVVINKDQTGIVNGKTQKSNTAYITFLNWHEAALAILSLNGQEFECRVFKVSFGMTKYCQYFISNSDCTNPDCLYLHALVEEDHPGFGDISICDQEGIPKDDEELIEKLIENKFNLNKFEEGLRVYKDQKGSFPSIKIGINKI